MTSSKLETPETFNLELVRLVEKHPCLYDNTYKEYGSKEHREVQDISWSVISNKLNEDVFEVKKRWKNLRASFSRIVKFNTQCSNADEKRKRTYYLYDDMHFLLPFMRTKPADDSLPVDVDVDIEEADEELELKPIVTMNADSDSTAHNSTENCRINGHAHDSDADSEMVNSKPVKGVGQNVQGNTWLHGFPPKRRRHNEAFSLQATNDGMKMGKYGVNNMMASHISDMPASPDMDFFKCLMPDVNQMTLDEKREMRMKFLAVIDEIMKRRT